MGTNKFWKWKNRIISDQEGEGSVTERTLFLNGTIAEESWFDDDVTPALFKDELVSGEGDITVWINSPGGDCVAAAQIYNMLMDYKGDVTVKIDGIAASAASVIAMAGTKVLVSPVSMPGAIEMSLSAEGDTATFYADNILYWTAEANNGYSGSLTIAEMPEDFAQKVLNQIKDNNGVLIEDSTATGTEFAMAFEFEGDINKKRILFYRCTAGRPDVGSSSKEDKIEPNKQEISIKASPRLDNHYVKASVADASSTAYSSWYGASPYEAVTTTVSASKTSTSTSGS